MADQHRPRDLVRRTENLELPLRALEAVRDLRQHLADVEKRALLIARQRGATVEDLAAALGITRQAVYYKLNQLDRRASPSEVTEGVAEISDLDEPPSTTSRRRRA